MFYINEKGNRYGGDVFNRLPKERQIGFIEITDKEHEVLLNTLHKEQKTFTIDNGEIIYNNIDISSDDILKSEKAALLSYLSSINYILINYGICFTEEKRTAFLDEVSSSFGITNREIFEKHYEAVARINEINDLLGED